jgi:hypothetical protein
MPLRIGTRGAPLLGKRFHPRDLGALLLHWWSADYGVTITSGTSVSPWVDQVGGLSIAQATGSKQPAWSATSFNGAYAGITGNITNSVNLETTSSGSLPLGSTAGLIIAAVSVTDTGVEHYVAYGGTAVRRLSKAANEAPSVGDNTVTLTGVTGSMLGVPGIHSGRWSGTTMEEWWNGLAVTPATIASLNTDFVRMRFFASSAATAANFSASTLRHIFITQDLSTALRQKLEGWAAWDSGTQGNLDASQAYKLVRP